MIISLTITLSLSCLDCECWNVHKGAERKIQHQGTWYYHCKCICYEHWQINISIHNTECNFNHCLRDDFKQIRAEEVSQDQRLLEMKFSANGLDKKVSTTVDL